MFDRELELEVCDLNVDGGAVARLDGRVYFLDRGLPGEIVLARVTGPKKRALLAEVLRSIRPSPDAVEPFCRHFGSCGGCSMQNLDYPAQLRFKQRRFVQALQRIAGLDLVDLPGRTDPADPAGQSDQSDRADRAGSALSPNWPPIIPAEKLRGYRNKMEYAFGPGERGVVLGLRRRGSREVLEIAGCPLQSGESASVLQAVQAWARRYGLGPWVEGTASGRASAGGSLRYLVLREPAYQLRQEPGAAAGSSGGGSGTGSGAGSGPGTQRSAELICGGQLPSKEAVEALWQELRQLGVSSFMLSRRKSRLGLARGEQIVKTYGPQNLWEQFGPLLLEFPLAGFSQTNTAVAAKLFEQAARFAAVSPAWPMEGLTGRRPAAGLPDTAKDTAAAGVWDELWDVYAGSGALALGLAAYGKKILGLELDAGSVRAARANAARLQLSHCRFAAGDAAELMESLFAPASRPRLLPPGYNGPQLLVADPPRSGMSARVLAAAKKSAPRRTVYVSCDPATLARDITALGPEYRLVEAALADMFPHTPHLEAVVRLERR